VVQPQDCCLLCVSLSSNDLVGTAIATLVGAIVPRFWTSSSRPSQHMSEERGVLGSYSDRRSNDGFFSAAIRATRDRAPIAVQGPLTVVPPHVLRPALLRRGYFALYQEQRRQLMTCLSVTSALNEPTFRSPRPLVATLDARDRYTAVIHLQLRSTRET